MAANPQPASGKVPTVKLLVGGKFVDSKAKAWRDVVNPATQEVLARVPMCDAAEVDEAVRNAAAAFRTWKNVPLGARARIMLKLQELIRRNMKKIAAALTAEQGKTLPDAEGDIFRGLEVVEHACSIGTLALGDVAAGNGTIQLKASGDITQTGNLTASELKVLGDGTWRSRARTTT